MIISLEGQQGTGKSQTAATLTYLDVRFAGRKLITNNSVNYPFTKFDPGFFLDHLNDHELENCDLWLDESYLMMDARTSGSKLVKLMSYFTVQTRKRNVDMYLCIHHIDTIDKRVRRAIDIRGTCRILEEEKPCRKCWGSGKIPKGGVCFYCQGDKEDFPDWNKPCPHCIDPETGQSTGRGDTCDRCYGCIDKRYGYTVYGRYRTSFFDKRHLLKRKFTVYGPRAWRLYQTEERIPFTGQQMRINVADL